MKLSKIITPILATSLLTSMPFAIVACANVEFVPSEMEQYISDRTFSIIKYTQYTYNHGTETTGYATLGTGWLLSDRTKDNTTDYKYYMATNWHVTYGFDTQVDEILAIHPDATIDGSVYLYADYSLSTAKDKPIPGDNYQAFERLEYDSEAEDFYFESNGVIDLNICEVDFAPNSLDSKIKQKLNRVNGFQKQNGYINKFVNGEDEAIKSKKKYVGGYPAKTEGNVTGGRWEVHAMKSSDLPYANDWERYGHEVAKYEHILVDISPQYVANRNYGVDWMTGGASGSMLITEDYEICGIYWGGESDKLDNPTWFKPRFSIVWSNKKNFIDKWL